MAELNAVRSSLGAVLGSLQMPGNPAVCAQAAQHIAAALRSVHWMSAPGQNVRQLAAQALNDVQQAHHMLEPQLGSHPSWQPVDGALHAAFNALSAIVSSLPAAQAQPAYGQAPQAGAVPIPIGGAQGQPMPASAAPQRQAPAPMPAEAWAVALLVMRHLYDGDVIDWPLPNDHPQYPLLHQLESLGFIARWDRTWPLRDRYRLTDKGIRELEKHYRPADAARIFQEIRESKPSSPKARQALLRKHGFDPWHFCVLHDPYTHWSTWGADHGSYYRYFWQEPGAPRQRKHQENPSDEPVGQAMHPQTWDEDRHVTVPLDDPSVVGGGSSWDDGPVRDLS